MSSGISTTRSRDHIERRPPEVGVGMSAGRSRAASDASVRPGELQKKMPETLGDQFRRDSRRNLARDSIVAGRAPAFCVAVLLPRGWNRRKSGDVRHSRPGRDSVAGGVAILMVWVSPLLLRRGPRPPACVSRAETSPDVAFAKTLGTTGAEAQYSKQNVRRSRESWDGSLMARS